jgi:CheY-like chemotaxis protein
MVGISLQAKSLKVAPAPVSIGQELSLRTAISPMDIQKFETVSSNSYTVIKAIDDETNHDGTTSEFGRPPPFKVIRILLVDDLAINRKMVRKMLEAEPSLLGCAIYEAEDGTDAVAFIARSMVSPAVDLTTIEAATAAEVGLSIAVTGPIANAGLVTGYDRKNGNHTDAVIDVPQIDCIFMDSVMKVMHGPETVQILRRDLCFQGPIIGLTGNAMPKDVEVFMRSGLDGILIKPVKRADLLGALISAQVVPKS